MVKPIPSCRGKVAFNVQNMLKFEVDCFDRMFAIFSVNPALDFYYQICRPVRAFLVLVFYLFLLLYYGGSHNIAGTIYQISSGPPPLKMNGPLCLEKIA